FYPDDDVAIAVLSNTDGDEAALVENALARRALGVPVPAGRAVAAAERTALSGRYGFRGGSLEVRAAGDGLEILGIDEQKPVRLVPVSGRTYALEARPEVVSFSPGEGPAAELRVTQFGAKRLVAKRGD